MYFKFLKVTIVSFLLAVGANSMMAQETLTFTKGQTITAGEEFHTSANVSIVIGSGETWEAAKTLTGLTDGAYYCHAQGDCDYNKYKENTYPTSGCYYKLRSYVNGTITLKMALKVDVEGDKKLYVLPDDGTTIKGYSVVYNGVTYYPGGSTSANDPKKAENNYAKIYSTGDATNYYPCTLTFKVEPYKNYYIVGLSCENLAFAGYSFTPSDDNKKVVSSSFTPFVHQHDTKISGITMMYGGWLSETDAKNAESLQTNGDTNYNYYTIDTKENGHTDAWKESTTDATDLFHSLDGYTTYVSDCTNDAKNEQIDFYNSSTQGIASLPCRGTYYKFEPTVDGHLSVYLMQNGRIESDIKVNQKTYGQLKTSRTLYFIDEFGVPQKAVYTKTNGVVDLPVAKLNDDAKKALKATIGSDYNGNYAEKVESTTDGGYFVYQKAATCYSFDVKAGKTYFLFANWSKLGLYGYTFGAAQTATSTAAIDETSSYNMTEQANTTVTITRTLLANTWNSLVLPFSMNETQVRAAFGDDTQVYYYNGVASNNFKFLKHYYQIIQAGVPCLIVPSKVSSNNTYTIKGVTINSEVTTVTADGYSFIGSYSPSTVPANSYFVGQKGDVGRIYSNTIEKSMNGMRAYLSQTSTNAAKVTGLSFDDDNSTVTAIEDVTTDVTVNNGNIYNLSGQLVKTCATNLDGLDKGIYILNGKKYVVK